jgi:D-xylose transport system permease protein
VSDGAATTTADADLERPESPLREFLGRLARGQYASVRVLVGIAVIWLIFQLANDRFLSAINLSNLVLQLTAVATISIGVVLVLLLGEIDLSVGAVSGLAAGVMAVLNVKTGVAAELAILAGLATGALVGLFNGLMVTMFRIPSFVVTLAGLLAWQGALLAVLGDTGTVNLPPTTITDLTTTFFDPAIGAAYVAIVLRERLLRVRAELDPPSMRAAIIRVSLVAAGVIGAVAVLNEDRGVPLAAVIMLSLMAIFSFITKRTRYGRHIFATGGNAEAARRAGIRIDRVRLSVFTLASTLAAAGGILAASRLLAVNQSSGGNDLLLIAIAGPVVAGTSLFGGRGFVYSALLGALLIQSISNGMDLLALSSDVKFMVTGAVLLLAVTIDAATRMRREPGAA